MNRKQPFGIDHQQRRQEMLATRAKRRGESADSGPSIADLFQRALADHQAGCLLQAQAVYREMKMTSLISILSAKL